MKVLFAASESHPFMKVGGLGDVAYALPKALRKLGVDVRVIIPKYSSISDSYKNQMTQLAAFGVPVGWRNQYCGLQYMEFDGIPFYFIDNEYYFKRDSSYGYYDDGERFSFFSRAVLEAINHMGGYKPDVIHCNDWHTGMITPLLREFYWYFNGMKTMFTIHNLQYQGIFPREVLSELLSLGDNYFNDEALKFYDCISFMKGGLNFANMITTVSETYAEEIQTPYYGEKLDGLLRARKDNLYGIVNGIDYDIFNPECDKDIFNNFKAEDIQGKMENKLELQRMLGLPVNGDVPLIGIVSRLVSQKGFDLIQSIFDELLKEDIQVVVLGTGEEQYENMFRYYQEKYPDKVSANIMFDNDRAKKIYAASDMFLMPSKFEPCGIGQLLAMRYGTIPIVRETGGLKDTVKPYNEFTGDGEGFTFSNYDAYDMLYTIRRAIHFYYNKDLWNRLVYKVMNEDNSWNRSAELYKELYLKLLYS